ncbi:MAG: 16S rRNA (cytidine(1402)-2'-O)-methyltransferase [Acidobacteriota bacterium]
MPGTLFVVATPIGNLEDLTFRALRILREVHLIAAEDTRRTSKLLAHYDIQKPLVSLHEHNESRETPQLVERLCRGEDIALVSDAGTPGISDPGQHLVAGARTAGVAVVPIPGPSAITAILSASGLPGTKFTFMGFPPSSGQEREDWLSAIKDEVGIVVFFESPHRVGRTMNDVATLSVDRPIVIGRELTKIHESLVLWDKNEALPPAGDAKGEFVVVIGQKSVAHKDGVDGTEADRLFGLITEHVTTDEDAALRGVASLLQRPVKRVRSAIKKARILKRRGEEA